MHEQGRLRRALHIARSNTQSGSRIEQTQVEEDKELELDALEDEPVSQFRLEYGDSFDGEPAWTNTGYLRPSNCLPVMASGPSMNSVVYPPDSAIFVPRNEEPSSRQLFERARASVAEKIKQKLRSQAREKDPGNSALNKAEKDAMHSLVAGRSAGPIRTQCNSPNEKLEDSPLFVSAKVKDLRDSMASKKRRSFLPKIQNDARGQTMSTSVDVVDADFPAYEHISPSLRNVDESHYWRSPSRRCRGQREPETAVEDSPPSLLRLESKAHNLRISLSYRFSRLQQRSMLMDVEGPCPLPDPHDRRMFMPITNAPSIADECTSDFLPNFAQRERIEPEHLDNLAERNPGACMFRTNVRSASRRPTTLPGVRPPDNVSMINKPYSNVSSGLAVNESIPQKQHCTTDSNSGLSTIDQLRILQSRLSESEARITSLLKQSEQNDEFLASEFPRIAHVLEVLDRAQEIRYRSLLDVFADNFRTTGQVEARFERLLIMQRDQRQSSSRGVMIRICWSVVDFAVACLMCLLHAIASVYQAIRYSINFRGMCIIL
jgi:hypothetical protein